MLLNCNYWVIHLNTVDSNVSADNFILALRRQTWQRNFQENGALNKDTSGTESNSNFTEKNI